MPVILSDEHCSKHSETIFHTLERLGYRELLSLELKTIEEVGLQYGADDETIWRFYQAQGYILLTSNRTMKDGQFSLEYIIRNLIQPTSLPVLTIGNLNRILVDRLYCEHCAERLAEIVLDIDDYLGITRVYL